MTHHRTSPTQYPLLAGEEPPDIHTAPCRYGQEGPWVYDACGQGHHCHDEGEGITWRRCCQCGHTEDTTAHLPAEDAAWQPVEAVAR